MGQNQKDTAYKSCHPFGRHGSPVWSIPPKKYRCVNGCHIAVHLYLDNLHCASMRHAAITTVEAVTRTLSVVLQLVPCG